MLTEITERPEGYVAPDLRPQDLVLHPKELAPGVWALLANQPPKDNNGLIVGEQAALVVDSGVTPQVGRQIRRLAADLTDRPVRYLAYTTHHGDHTFGSSAFGPEATVVSSDTVREAMTDLRMEKAARQESMYGTDALEAVHRWRHPDVTFERSLSIDLGGRDVELWHFGPGNGPGDTLVHLPTEKITWTGNFLVPAGFVPMLLAGAPATYLASLEAMDAALDLDLIIPGHGYPAPARPAIDWLRHYLQAMATDPPPSPPKPPDDLALPANAVSLASRLNAGFHALNLLTCADQ